MSPDELPIVAMVSYLVGRLQHRRAESAVGPGAFTSSPTAWPGTVQALDQHHSRLGHCPDGKPPSRRVCTRIPDRHTRACRVRKALTELGADWRAGRIGDWVRIYRPDLVG